MKQKTIALIAHDRKKADMVAFATQNKWKLEKFNLIGTGNTAKLVREKTGLKIRAYHSGPYGGDVEIAALVVKGKCDAVVFLHDPLEPHPHDPDIKTLMRVCDVYNIPLATNLSTAEIIINAMSDLKTLDK